MPKRGLSHFPIRVDGVSYCPLSSGFRLKAPDGTVLAVSQSFPDKPAAVAGISAVHEHAGMGLITDLCPEVPVQGASQSHPAPGVRQASVPSSDLAAKAPYSTTEAPQRTTATGSYNPADPRRGRVGPSLNKVA